MVFPPRLCLPHPPNSLCDTNVIRLKFVQSNGGGEGGKTQEPAQERPGLGHTLLGEVVDNRCPVICKLMLSSSAKLT